MAFLIGVAFSPLAPDRFLWAALRLRLSVVLLYRTLANNAGWEIVQNVVSMLNSIPMKDSKRVFCSPKRAAERLEVSDDTIRRWLRDGKLRGVKVVGAWKVYLSDIQRILTPTETK